MNEPKTYYIEVISSEEMYDGTHWQQTVENSPCLYHDEKGEASDVTHMVAALRAENDRLRAAATLAHAVLTRLADSAAYWADYDVPVGIVAEIDAAKARLAGALNV